MESPTKKRPKLEDHEDTPYFKSYSDISIHEEMLSDRVRTTTYRKAILRNYEKIYGKTVVDIGAGTGILSMFCVHAGAKKVYAIEASDMAVEARKVIAANGMQDRITVIHSKVEDAELPEKVDVIVSEWMGYFLLYETMLPSVILARDQWLKPGGLILPDKAALYLAPFTDVDNDLARHEFWEKEILSLYKLDLSAIVPYADACRANHVHVRELDFQDILAHNERVAELDLNTVSTEQLKEVKGAFKFSCFGYGEVHGFASWFKVYFPGGIELSTSPYEDGTHWAQSLVYFDKALKVKQDTKIAGTVCLTPHHNNKRYLDITFEYTVDDGSPQKKECLMNDFVT